MLNMADSALRIEASMSFLLCRRSGGKCDGKAGLCTCRCTVRGEEPLAACVAAGR